MTLASMSWRTCGAFCIAHVGSFGCEVPGFLDLLRPARHRLLISAKADPRDHFSRGQFRARLALGDGGKWERNAVGLVRPELMIP